MSSNNNQQEFVFGGTFDPFHHGHLAVIQALQLLAAEIPIRLLPCAIPAIKAKPSASFEQRVEMLKLATSHLSNLVVDESEQDRLKPSYTFDTLVQLQKSQPNQKHLLVIGADSLLNLTQWYCWQQLASMCHLVVVTRPNIDEKDLSNAMTTSQFNFVKGFNDLTKTSSGLGFWLKMVEKRESSTQIRQSIDNNELLDVMLPQSVIKYIHKHNLYTSEKT